jgi:TPP-dependent pyruvate/acetoin dehydrogenase alpha subunit
MDTFDPSLTREFYKTMLLIRKFEQHLAAIYHTDVVKSPIHLSIGQESVAVGVCAALKKNDIVSNTYRCHATYIAKGGNLNEMMAELYGKKDGCAAGKAGSMHLVDIKNGIMGASAVVGTTISVATGYALALKREAQETQQQRVVAAVFGDGATEEGCFSESINFAALHQLPIIYICENNRLAIHASIEQRWATEKLCERVETYGIRTHKITDGDVFKLYETMNQELSNIRQGVQGPVFIECATYRWFEHVGPTDDHHQKYRNNQDYQWWRDNDQILRLANLLSYAIREAVESEVDALIQEADTFARNSPFPSDEELYTHVYAD